MAKESNQVKKQFRDGCMAMKLKNKHAKYEQRTMDTTNKFKRGVFRSILQMAEKEGGLIDPEQGMAIAVRIAKIQEKKGVLFLMYDSDAEVVRYLHVEQGSDESFFTSAGDSHWR